MVVQALPLPPPPPPLTLPHSTERWQLPRRRCKSAWQGAKRGTQAAALAAPAALGVGARQQTAGSSAEVAALAAARGRGASQRRPAQSPLRHHPHPHPQQQQQQQQQHQVLHAPGATTARWTTFGALPHPVLLHKPEQQVLAAAAVGAAVAAAARQSHPPPTALQRRPSRTRTPPPLRCARQRRESFTRTWRAAQSTLALGTLTFSWPLTLPCASSNSPG